MDDLSTCSYEYFIISYCVTKMTFSFSFTLDCIRTNIYLAKGTAEFTFLYHVDTASPTDMFMVAFGYDEYFSLLAAEQARRVVVHLNILHGNNCWKLSKNNNILLNNLELINLFIHLSLLLT